MSFEKKCNSLFKNMPKIKGQSDILISRFDFLPSLAQHIKLDVFKSKIHVKFKGEPGEVNIYIYIYIEFYIYLALQG